MGQRHGYQSANFDEDGYEIFKCSRCGETKLIIIPAHGQPLYVGIRSKPISNIFVPISPVVWSDLGGGALLGKVTLAYMSSGEFGFSSRPAVDIAIFSYLGKTEGRATKKLAKAEITGINHSNMELFWINAVLDPAVTTTSIEKPYLIYDITRDRKVNPLDLASALLYIEFTRNDPEWDTLVRVLDYHKVGITASRCDVNADGIVNMLDLMLILSNYD